MAARFWIGGGTNTNWSASPTTNWAATSGGTTRVAAPTSTDDVTFDGVGVNGNTVSVITTTTCLSFTVTSGYTSTITWSAVLTVAGSITLGANMTIAGTSQITSSATGTLTSNGKTWPNGLTITTAGTRTFADAWTITGQITISGATTITLSGLLTVGGTFLVAGSLIFAGTFGWTSTAFIMNTIAASTLTLQHGITYTITTSMQVSFSSAANTTTITSEDAALLAILTLGNGVTCKCNCKFTRIDASAGRRINTFNATVTSCINVFSYTDTLPASKIGIVAGSL